MHMLLKLNILVCKIYIWVFLLFCRDMPSIMYYGNGSPEWFRDYPRNPDGLIKVYMLPPVLYPDGTPNITIKPALSGHSKYNKTKVLKPCGTLMQVKSSTEHSALLLTYINGLSVLRKAFFVFFEWPLKQISLYYYFSIYKLVYFTM